MKKKAWLLAIPGLALAIAVKPVLRPVETLNAAQIADSLKRSLPKVAVASAPVSAAPSPSAPDSVRVKRFRMLNRPMNREDVKNFLAAFQVQASGNPESTSVSVVWRDKRGATLAYESGTSDMAFANESVPMLDTKDFVPDSLIRSKTDELLRKILKGKAERYVFVNHEITMVQRKDAGRKDSVAPAVPAYYYGRYLLKLDGRIVLGDAFQVRVGYGEGGALQTFSQRDPLLAEGGVETIPTKEKVLDSLKRWERSKTHSRAYTYPYHQDHLQIQSLKPVKVFNSYVLGEEKFRDSPNLNGTYLLPSVTVLAQVVVAPSRKKLTEPAPEEPVLLHFHFPCRPASGLCWPDGNQDLVDEISQGSQPASLPVRSMVPPRTGVTPTMGNPGTSLPK